VFRALEPKSRGRILFQCPGAHDLNSILEPKNKGRIGPDSPNREEKDWPPKKSVLELAESPRRAQLGNLFRERLKFAQTRGQRRAKQRLVSEAPVLGDAKASAPAGLDIASQRPARPAQNRVLAFRGLAHIPGTVGAALICV